MREYGIISPKFWIGKTGRKLRAHPYAQRVALYLMTAPNADMTGVYYCPLSSILNDVGSPSNVPLKPLESPFEAPCEGYKNPFEGVRAALSVLEELGFCVYDVENEYVFVVEMARWQVAERLKATDNRVKGIKKYVESMPDGLRQRFINRYNDAFSLGLQVSPIEAPYKPLRSQEQEQEQEQEQKKPVERVNPVNTTGGDFCPTVDDFGAAPEAVPEPPPVATGTGVTRTPLYPFPDSLPEDWGIAAAKQRPDVSAEAVFLKLRDRLRERYPGEKRTMAMWLRQFLQWIATERVIGKPLGREETPEEKQKSIENAERFAAAMRKRLEEANN